MGLTLVAPATVLPVTLAEARDYCGVEDDSRDALLTRLVRAAAARVQTYVSRSLAPEGWRLTLDRFSETIELARGPVVAVTAVGYADPDGVARVVDPGAYTLDLVSNPQWLVLNSDERWPETLDGINAVTIDFTAGYTAEALPDDLALAVLLQTAALFQDRARETLPRAVRALADPYRRIVI